MHFTQAYKMAIKCISDNKMRSFLTMLGIIIGVASIIAIIGAISSLSQKITGDINNKSKIYLSVQIMQRVENNRKVTLENLEEFAQENADVISTAGPSISGNVTIKFGDKNIPQTSLEGASDQYFNLMNLKIAKGRFLSFLDVEERQNVVVINSNIEKKLFKGEDPLNKEIRLNGELYYVIGVLKAAKFDSTKDYKVYIPFTKATRLIGNTTLNSFIIKADSNELLDTAMKRTDKFLMQIFESKDDYFIMSPKEVLAQINMMTTIFSVLLGSIAGISLLVSGIGIMNIMLVSVTERTREIGIRKAIGATRKNIMSQFLIEASLLSGLGGVVGIAVGVSLVKIAGFIVSRVYKEQIGDIQAAVPLGAIILAVCFSCAIGIFFGWAPANKASKLNPLDALRAE